jgi:Reverse transcriptase (RNA-dependent DNA polymerase)
LLAPKCAACQFGKQGRTPIPTHHTDKDPVGSLTKDKLEPGQLVFADQYESREPGRAFTTKGAASSHKFGGGTLFIDAASNYVYVSHQVGTTANETIQAKVKFEREAITAGVTVQAYHTDNGVFTSKEFMRELAEKGQGITLSGVSAQFQNGAAENAIKIVVRNARTMMIHATLRWPGFVEKDLWPMALSHAAYLYNITPNMETGVSPISVWTRTTQESNALRNSHTWGCPVYVLTPKLKDGQKIPKWEPRSRRGQYVGNSPMHASTVGLIRNLQTGTITPQYHLVYDDYFETVHSREDQEPENWGELLRFGRFQTEFDEDDGVPELPDEWLNPQELVERTTRRQQERDAILLRHGANETPIEPAPVIAPQVVAPTVIAPQPAPTVTEPQIVVPLPAPTIQNVRPARTRNQPVRFIDEHARYYTRAAGALCMATAKGLVSCSLGYESDYRYLLALLTDVDTGHVDGLHPSMLQFAGSYKAAAGKDPDLPTYREAMAGPDAEFYEEAMKLEISDLEDHGTWELVPRKSIPSKCKVLPSTWVLRAKRYPDGRLQKHKARFCVRGDRQVEGVDYTDKYSPVVSWSTVRMLMTLSLKENLSTRQVDFSNAFVQAMLDADEHIYVETPKGFEYSDDDGDQHVLKLKRSLYGLVQAPLYWGNHLKDALEKQGLKQSASDPCMYHGDGVIVKIGCE